MTVVEVEKRGKYHGGSVVGLMVLLFFIALMLVAAFIGWLVFAVRNPNSSAGQCLIQVMLLMHRLNLLLCTFKQPVL